MKLQKNRVRVWSVKKPNARMRRIASRLGKRLDSFIHRMSRQSWISVDQSVLYTARLRLYDWCVPVRINGNKKPNRAERRKLYLREGINSNIVLIKPDFAIWEKAPLIHEGRQ